MANDEKPVTTVTDPTMVELARTGQLQHVLRFVMDDWRQWRIDLDGHLLAELLTDEAQRAKVFAMQGALKAIADLNAKLRTLGGLRPPETN